jgi:hypothetical protein
LRMRVSWRRGAECAGTGYEDELANGTTHGDSPGCRCSIGPEARAAPLRTGASAPFARWVAGGESPRRLLRLGTKSIATHEALSTPLRVKSNTG